MHSRCTWSERRPSVFPHPSTPHRQILMAPIHDATMTGNSSRVRELVERQGADAAALDGNGQVANGEESEDEDYDDGEVSMAPVHYAAMFE